MLPASAISDDPKARLWYYFGTRRRHMSEQIRDIGRNGKILHPAELICAGPAITKHYIGRTIAIFSLFC